MRLYIPAKISSIITPTPPLRYSILRIPNGLKISNRRNSANAARAYHKLPAGAAKSGIQTPTISSTTTREGSSPQIGSTAFAERMPAIVKIPINNAVIIISRVGDTAHDNASQISVANKAHAVPGANGEKPEPKPVAIII